ncbi:ras-like protein family member 10B [Watersipora subatra]|uniref:ras-like protein family member 10B n=1 Tax=Watersipora subatra TaxID=2589382 RepID=UPI00355AF295
MQMDRNSKRHVAYELIKPELVLPGLPGDSGSAESSAQAAEYCVAPEVSVDMTGYDERSEDILRYNIAFLGSGKVGKTSILQQFLYQNFDEEYTPTPHCEKYRKAVYMNGRIFDITFRDCPGVAHFPDNTISEWTECNGFYGLHLSQVFVLIYDTSNESTFSYVQSMREQILKKKGNETLIVVVGNKQDLTDPRNIYLKSHMQHIIKKWKCPFVFCSAKYNWHIVKVFNETLKTIGTQIDSKKETSQRNNSRWKMPRCKIS